MRPVLKVLDSQYMKDDVEAIDRHFEGLLDKWAGRLRPYRAVVGDDFTFVCLPLLVNKAFRFLGNEPEISLTMASLFKTVYFSNTINLALRDEDEGQLNNQEMQFSILIADYIFGRVLKALLECDAHWLLDDFSVMMAEINEGFVWQHCMHADLYTILEKTRLPLYTMAFYAAGRIAGCDRESALSYSRIGRNLGMAMELYAIGDGRSREYLLNADAMLQNLNIRNRNYEHDLCRLVDMLAEDSRSNSQIAAV